ncbi:MAG: rod shape-determining protein MreD [Firmicutes bacterium]|nr:rod shape-determining protein MreD [Bacillota bacterium]
MRMKVLIYVVSIFVIILVQTTVLDYIEINNIKPNLILVYSVCISILEGSMGGAVIGLFAGLVQDIVSGKTLGFYSLLGMYLGAIAGLASKKLYKDNILVVVLFTFFLTMVYESGVYLLSRFGNLRSPGLLYIFKTVVFPEALYNSAFSILIHFMVIKVNSKLNFRSKVIRRY